MHPLSKTAIPLLAIRLKRDVAGAVRGRGQEYFDSDLVQLEETDSDWVAATVHGTQRYDVTLQHDARRKRLKALCTCPYFLDNWEPCKHVWATVLEVQELGLFSDAAKAPGLRLEVDEAALSEWTGPDADDDEFDDWEQSPAPLPTPTRKAAHRAPTDVWRQQLAAVSDAMRLQSETDDRRWPPGRQVLYVLDLADTRSSDALVLDVQCRDRKTNGQWGEPRTRTIERDVVSWCPL